MDEEDKSKCPECGAKMLDWRREIEAPSVWECPNCGYREKVK